MSEATQENVLKIPIVKKEAIIPIEIDYNTIGALVQGLFLIAGKWDQNQIDAFKAHLEAKEQVKDPQQVTYILLDRLYRQVLKKAQEMDLVEFTEVNIGSPLENK